MEREPLISIIILDVENHHLLQLTIESILAQKETCYEIIIITQNVSRDLNEIKKHSKRIKIINVPQELTTCEIRNRAIKESLGKYLHFLFPGEYYLSMYSLSIISEKIETKKEPDLLCFSFLKRQLFAFPEIRKPTLTKSSLGSERFPIYGKDVIFSKGSLIEMGGFDPRYKNLEIFDAVAKIHLKDRSKIFCSKRVVVDYELLKVPPKKLILQIKEMIAIITREYGFKNLFHRGVLREMFDLLKYLGIGMKRYFMQAD